MKARYSEPLIVPFPYHILKKHGDVISDNHERLDDRSGCW
jgi:hypothetical protein